jgi:hypothetical protein
MTWAVVVRVSAGFAVKSGPDWNRDCPKRNNARQLFATVGECAGVSRKGDRRMRAVLSEVLLLSCVGAFFVGLVIAAASLLG